jgi:isocitrate dehydrogenase kinase/phosphatase
MLTTDKILAHKTHGKNLILLTQVGSSFFFVVAHVVQSKSFFSRKSSTSRKSLKTIFQRQVSEVEALAIFKELSGINTYAQPSTELLLSDANSVAAHTYSTNNITSDEAVTLLLVGATQKSEIETTDSKPKPVVSPYFPTKDIFLSVQKTRAPAIA